MRVQEGGEEGHESLGGRGEGGMRVQEGGEGGHESPGGGGGGA